GRMGTGASAAQKNGRAPADRGDGGSDLEFAGDKNECRTAAGGIAIRTNDEARMTNDEGSTNAQMTKRASQNSTRNSDFGIPSAFNASPARTIRHPSLAGGLISNAPGLIELLPLIERNSRVAVDTEADSLHCYREKLCLLQVSLAEGGVWVDPLAGTALAPLANTLTRKEIVLHG